MAVFEIVSLEWLTYYLIGISFVSFATFAMDKWFAETGRSRISEDTLLTWALLGGTPGAYAGRQAFRHKTRKQPFSNHLHMIAAAQVALIAFLAFY